MTLVFMDGFDHYTTLTQKYVTNQNASISASAARTGTGGHMNGATQGGATYAIPNAYEHATLIVGFAYRRTAFNTNGNSLITFLSDSQVTSHVAVVTKTDGSIEVKRGNHAGTVLATSSATPFSATNVWHYVEIKVTLSDSAGVVQVRIDGNTTPIINLSSADTKNAGTKTVFDGFQLSPGAGYGGENQIDDLYLCNGAGTSHNDFLGECRVETVLPTANGATSGLTGSDGNSTDNYALVDEAAPNTTDYVQSSVTNTKDTYGVGDLVTTAGTVHAVQLSAYAQKDGTGSRSVAFVKRTSGSDVDGTDLMVGTGWALVREIHTTDSQASAWTVGSVNGAEFGVKVR